MFNWDVAKGVTVSAIDVAAILLWDRGQRALAVARLRALPGFVFWSLPVFVLLVVRFFAPVFWLEVELTDLWVLGCLRAWSKLPVVILGPWHLVRIRYN